MDANVHAPNPDLGGRAAEPAEEGVNMIDPEDQDIRRGGFVVGGPRALLRLEALAALAGLAAWYQSASADWLMFAVLFLVPDLSMLGYLAGRRIGAVCYNAAHSYLGPIALLAAAQVDPRLLPFGLIWAAHVAFDRALGYGLKYGTAFGDTHLGLVGKRKAALAAAAA